MSRQGRLGPASSGDRCRGWAQRRRDRQRAVTHEDRVAVGVGPCDTLRRWRRRHPACCRQRTAVRGCRPSSRRRDGQRNPSFRRVRSRRPSGWSGSDSLVPRRGSDPARPIAAVQAVKETCRKARRCMVGAFSSVLDGRVRGGAEAQIACVAQGRDLALGVAELAQDAVGVGAQSRGGALGSGSPLARRKPARTTATSRSTPGASVKRFTSPRSTTCGCSSTWHRQDLAGRHARRVEEA